VADRVNRLDPDTRWRGLADIVRHFYFIKLRDDSHYDVLAFSRSIDLENTSARDSVFYVAERQFAQPDLAAVLVDGHNCTYQLRDGYLHFSVRIPARQTRRIELEYEPPVPSPPVSIAKTSLRVYCLRMISDFRDNVMYKNALGRAVINSYYDGNGNPNPARLFEWAFAFMFLCGCLGWSIRVIVRRRRLTAVEFACSSYHKRA
jgi:hypothetical protein